ncbi:hypothetical protein FQN57_005581 [Myotisia sp. PD_48]|nr:hypothetical protein FQN57_005581 [Myotisia sp. PD_48]
MSSPSVGSATEETRLPCSSRLITALISQLSKTVPESPPPINADPMQDTTASTPSYYYKYILADVPTRNNSLSRLPLAVLGQVKPVLITLHCLFPNEFILALDILDRKLVTKVPPELGHHNGLSGLEPHGGRDGWDGQQRCSESSKIYLVQSSSPRHHRVSSHHLITYQVCLNAWNCTCPAFTLAMFQDTSNDDENTATQNDINQEQSQTWAQQQKGQMHKELQSGSKNRQDDSWIFGGYLTQNVQQSVTKPCSPHCGGALSGCCYMHDSPPVCKHLLACVLASQCPSLFGHGVDGGRFDRQEIAGRFAK